MSAIQHPAPSLTGDRTARSALLMAGGLLLCAFCCSAPALAALGLGTAAISTLGPYGERAGLALFALGAVGFVWKLVRRLRARPRPLEPLIIPARPGAPIACDMTGAPDSPDGRVAEYGRLFVHALVDRQRSGDGLELTFAAKAGVAAWVADLVRREAACCPFFSYQVTFTADHVRWRTSSQAGPAAQAMLDELFALPDRFADGMNGLLDRLRTRGFPVASPSPGHFTLEGATGTASTPKGGCGC